MESLVPLVLLEIKEKSFQFRRAQNGKTIGKDMRLRIHPKF